MRPVSRTHPRRRDDDATRRETTTRRASIRARIHRVAVTYLVSIETTRRKVTTGAARGGVSSRSSHRRAGSEGRRRRGRAAARRVGWVFPRFFVAADWGGGVARGRDRSMVRVPPVSLKRGFRVRWGVTGHAVRRYIRFRRD